MAYPDSSLSEMITLEIVEDKSLDLIPDPVIRELAALQTIHEGLLELLYKYRKYNRNTPDLGWPIWFGRATKHLEDTEKQIDEIQQKIIRHTSIQYN